MSKQAMINFFSPINQESIQALIRAFREAITDGETENIKLLISSPGGTVQHGVLAYNFIRGCVKQGITVETHNLSLVDSVALVLYLAADIRVGYPSSLFRFRPITHGLGPSSEEKRLGELELTQLLASIQSDTDSLAQILANETDLEFENARALFSSGETWTTEQAKDAGLVTKIIAHAPSS